MKRHFNSSNRIRVAVLISTDMGVRRESLRGIYHYASSKTGWELALMWPPEQDMCRSLARKSISGILVWPSFEGELDEVKQLGVPVVTLGSLVQPGYPSVNFDNRAAAELGVEELAQKGLKNIAFYASRNRMLYSRHRRQGYLHAMKRLGLKCEIHEEAAMEPNWRKLEVWLAHLIKPSGILADSDVGGMSLLTAAHHHEIEIPDELPIISIGGDDLICPLLSPSLSSVALPGFEVGVEAARMLDSLLKNEKPMDIHRVITPQHMVERRSSQFFYAQDPNVAWALRFIRDHVSEALTVPIVLEEVSLSRRPLEKRFKELTGKTIQKAIWKAKLDMARRLLWETSLSVAEVADACGFSEPQRMTEVFKRELGISPKAFRHKIVNSQKIDS